MRISKRSFSAKQVDRISNIFDNVGNILFGVTVLAPVIADFDKVNLLIVILGLVSTFFCWMFSVWLVRKRT